MKIISPIQDFFNLLYPNICEACGTPLVKGEEIICTKCLYDIPKTEFWNTPDNQVEQAFWGRVNIEHAASFFYFTKGSKYRKLLHKLKYSGRRDIGIFLGERFGNELNKSTFYKNIDYIVPVPLHSKKLRIRGYNQSEQICIGLSQTMNVPINIKSLARIEFTATQTKKNRLERWQNVSEVFEVKNADEIKGKHLLLVDDVLTTGATLEACCNAIFSAVPNCKISVATIACVK